MLFTMNQGLGFSLTPGVAPIQASLHNTESNVSVTEINEEYSLLTSRDWMFLMSSWWKNN